MTSEAAITDTEVDWDYWRCHSALLASEAARLMLRMDPKTVSTQRARDNPQYKGLLKIFLREKMIRSGWVREICSIFAIALNWKCPRKCARDFIAFTERNRRPKRR